jgi:pimeloyl-ACP methyl ester carboxylesterase
MTDPIILTDHAGARLARGKPKVNGVEIHYAIGGTGEPVFLLHGVPKTMSYRRHVVPLLTPHYTVVAVDNRGFGSSQRPLAGYDTATMAGDVAELATPPRLRPVPHRGRGLGRGHRLRRRRLPPAPGAAAGVPGDAAARIAGRRPRSVARPR